jgi:hypothetical protein
LYLSEIGAKIGERLLPRSFGNGNLYTCEEGLMKLKMFFLAVLAVLLLLAALPAGATLLTYNGNPAGFSDGNFYVGDASGTLGGSDITMWCVDPAHIISASSWDVTVVSLANPVGLAGLLGLTVDDYKAMFLLGKQFTNTSQSADVSLQHEIWWFAAPGSYPLNASQQTAVNTALATVGSYNWTNAYVLVPTGNQSGWKGQIFDEGSVGKVPGVPEPVTFVLLGSGLLGLGLIRFRCNRTQ